MSGGVPTGQRARVRDRLGLRGLLGPAVASFNGAPPSLELHQTGRFLNAALAIDDLAAQIHKAEG